MSNISPLDSPALTLPEAHRLLKQFDCLRPADSIITAEQEQLRQAVLLVAKHSDYQIFGICADAIAPAQQSLEAYAKALGYTQKPSFPVIEGAVYIKFNPKSGLCYADTYTGQHRGVLISCQSAYADQLNDMYGHLPLNLFSAT
jgi:hypothetical protein